MSSMADFVLQLKSEYSIAIVGWLFALVSQLQLGF